MAQACYYNIQRPSKTHSPVHLARAETLARNDSSFAISGRKQSAARYLRGQGNSGTLPLFTSPHYSKQNTAKTKGFTLYAATNLRYDNIDVVWTSEIAHLDMRYSSGPLCVNHIAVLPIRLFSHCLFPLNARKVSFPFCWIPQYVIGNGSAPVCMQFMHTIFIFKCLTSYLQ